MLGDIIPKFPQGYFREENLIDGTIGFGKSFSATSTEKLLRILKFGSHCGLDLDNLGFMELRAWIAEILTGRFGATNIYSSCTFFFVKRTANPLATIQSCGSGERGELDLVDGAAAP